jgi:hypothetical protein
MNTELAAYQKAVESAKEQIAQLTRERDQAEFKATILQAQLGGWEAACAAQVAAIRRALDGCVFCREGTCRADAHQWLREAIDSNAGELLLKRLAQLEDALRQAGHADSCALQYGGACSCRMQLVRH